MNMKTRVQPPLRPLVPTSRVVAILFGVSLLVLSACSQDAASDCQALLDQKKFTAVSENSSCSDYQRASAYMGRAGFLFENFLADGATDNFRDALGVPASATDYDTWDGATYYTEALRLTGEDVGDEYYGLSRTNDLIEIHYFSTLASLLAETYIDLDSDGNGEVAETEINDFTQIRATDDDDYGSNDIAASDIFQITTSGTVYLLNTAANLQSAGCTTDASDSGVFFANGGTGSSLSGCGFVTTAELASVAAGSNLTKTGSCAVVATVNDVQNMFSSTIEAGGSVTALTENFVAALSNLEADLEDLGVPADSELRDALNTFTDNLDNGGSCSSTTSGEVDQLLNLVDEAQAEAASSYQTLNVISEDTLTSSSDNDITFPTTTVTIGAGTLTISCTNSSNLDVRMIYLHPDGTYYDYYTPSSTTDQATSGIYTTFTSLINIRLDEAGDTKANVAGDSIISFPELLCMQ